MQLLRFSPSFLFFPYPFELYFPLLFESWLTPFPPHFRSAPRFPLLNLIYRMRRHDVYVTYELYMKYPATRTCSTLVGEISASVRCNGN
jgi:hypothetical protein